MLDKMKDTGCGCDSIKPCLMPLDAATSLTLDGITLAAEPEVVSISQRAGRVAAGTVLDAEAMPTFDNSAMDGFAVSTADCQSTTRLPNSAEIAAGDAPTPRNLQRLHAVAAHTAELHVKINTMALCGFNDAEIPDLEDWALERDSDVAFIEVMPMGEVGTDALLGRYWPLGERLRLLEERSTLCSTPFCIGVFSRYCDVLGIRQHIGFITPMSRNFCASCNPVRVNCRRELFTCLGREGSCDLRFAPRKCEYFGRPQGGPWSPAVQAIGP